MVGLRSRCARYQDGHSERTAPLAIGSGAMRQRRDECSSTSGCLNQLFKWLLSILAYLGFASFAIESLVRRPVQAPGGTMTAIRHGNLHIQLLVQHGTRLDRVEPETPAPQVRVSGVDSSRNREWARGLSHVSVSVDVDTARLPRAPPSQLLRSGGASEQSSTMNPIGRIRRLFLRSFL